MCSFEDGDRRAGKLSSVLEKDPLQASLFRERISSQKENGI